MLCWSTKSSNKKTARLKYFFKVKNCGGEVSTAPYYFIIFVCKILVYIQHISRSTPQVRGFSLARLSIEHTPINPLPLHP